MLWWICWVCVFKHARHQLKRKKHIHWVKNKSKQTPHRIFTQHKTHFDYAPKKKAITFTVPNTPICQKKKKSNHIHSSTHTHLPRKKNYQRKVQQLNKTQMRKLKKVHIFKNPRWEFTLFDSILLSYRARPQQGEREIFLEWLICLIFSL